MKKRAVWILVAVPAVMLGQFGMSIVSDPGTYGHLINSLNQALKEYQLAQQAYAVSMQAYINLDRAARNIQGKEVWLPAPTVWYPPRPTNTYGTTAGWSQAVTTGTNAAGGYRATTMPLGTYGPAWGSMSATDQARVARQYGTVEIQDASTISAMNQVGEIRRQSAANDAAIARLAADSASMNPAMNTQVGVLNQINAGGVIAAQQQRATNQMMAAMVEQQAVQSQRQRELAAQSIADDIAWRQSGPALTSAMWSGTNAGRYQRLP